MQSHMIPEDEWVEFFDQFSKSHAGWPVTIEVLSEDAGPQLLAGDLPLQGISFDTRGTRASALHVSAGDRIDANVEHVIDMPLRIHILGDDPESHNIDVQIEPADGPLTLLHIHRPS
jgi:hypothetical protein